MYISDYNKEKAKDKGKKLAFWLGWISSPIWIYILKVYLGHYYPTAIFDHFEEIIRFVLVYGLVFGWGFGLAFSFFLGWFFKIIVARKLQKRENETEKHNYKMQSYREQNEQNVQLETKRRNLQIELEHYAKIAMIQASQDQQKMQMLYEMERKLESQKSSDLDELDAQINRLKREL